MQRPFYMLFLHCAVIAICFFCWQAKRCGKRMRKWVVSCIIFGTVCSLQLPLLSLVWRSHWQKDFLKIDFSNMGIKWNFKMCIWLKPLEKSRQFKKKMILRCVRYINIEWKKFHRTWMFPSKASLGFYCFP